MMSHGSLGIFHTKHPVSNWNQIGFSEPPKSGETISESQLVLGNPQDFLPKILKPSTNYIDSIFPKLGVVKKKSLKLKPPQQKNVLRLPSIFFPS